MPTYEYACAACGNRYEKRESFEAPVRQKCPKCRKMAARVLSVPAVVFKGTGFYKTDSRGADTSDQPPAATPATTTAADGGHAHGSDGPSHGADATPAADTPKSDSGAKSEAAKSDSAKPKGGGSKTKTETPAAS